MKGFLDDNVYAWKVGDKIIWRSDAKKLATGKLDGEIDLPVYVLYHIYMIATQFEVWWMSGGMVHMADSRNMYRFRTQSEIDLPNIAYPFQEARGLHGEIRLIISEAEYEEILFGLETSITDRCDKPDCVKFI